MSAEVEQLIALRQRFNLPRKYVAFRLGCHSVTIFRWEKGRSYPSPLYLNALRSYVNRYPAERARSGGVNA